MSDIMFRRINGRIIPLSKGAGGYHLKPKKNGLKAKAAMTAAGGAVGLAAHKVTKLDSSSLKFASSALAIGAGIVSGLPFGGGFKGAVKGQAAAFGIDAVGSAANAAHAAKLKGTKKEKAKAFVKQEALNTGLGYAAMGATLLAQPAIREKLVAWGAKLLYKKVL